MDTKGGKLAAVGGGESHQSASSKRASHTVSHHEWSSHLGLGTPVHSTNAKKWRVNKLLP